MKYVFFVLVILMLAALNKGMGFPWSAFYVDVVIFGGLYWMITRFKTK